MVPPPTYQSTKYLDFGFLKPSLIILQVPDTEGRAGMVAVPDPDHTLDLKKLFIGVMDKLPGYARPFFVRCVQQLDLTGSNHMTPLMSLRLFIGVIDYLVSIYLYI